MTIRSGEEGGPGVGRSAGDSGVRRKVTQECERFVVLEALRQATIVLCETLQTSGTLCFKIMSEIPAD